MLVTDIAQSLEAAGIRKLVLVNAHGGNYVLSNIVREAHLIEPRMSLFPQSGEWHRARERAGPATNAHKDMHAGEIKTSILHHAEPSLVGPGHETADHDGGERRFLLTEGMKAYTETGVIGFPSHATAEKGRGAHEGPGPVTKGGSPPCGPHRLSTITCTGLIRRRLPAARGAGRVNACVDCFCSPRCCSPRCCCPPPAAGWCSPPRTRRRTPRVRWRGRPASGSTGSVRGRRRRSGAPLPASTGWRSCG
ncbi:creatininase family protein [Streptomyces sp. NPDC088732]|uniref:creatininase family protein n=1 Tax=Streptomyces sp. NPDC088732 TaxID=3365879 RepID=UPI003820DEAB